MPGRLTNTRTLRHEASRAERINLAALSSRKEVWARNGGKDPEDVESRLPGGGEKERAALPHRISRALSQTASPGWGAPALGARSSRRARTRLLAPADSDWSPEPAAEATVTSP